jgi:biotin carboxyl carrier protein
MYKHPGDIESVSIDGKTIPFENIDQSAEIIQLSQDGTCVIRYKNRKFRFILDLSLIENGIAKASAKGHIFEIKINTRIATLIDELGFNKSAQNHHMQVIAPMPGLVLKTLVVVGESVQEGQTLLTLEAMKMENVIKSPRDGFIKEIYAQDGDKVDKGDVLILFDT